MPERPVAFDELRYFKQVTEFWLQDKEYESAHQPPLYPLFIFGILGYPLLPCKPFKLS
jgi:hypothetical protein